MDKISKTIQEGLGVTQQEIIDFLYFLLAMLGFYLFIYLYCMAFGYKL